MLLLAGEGPTGGILEDSSRLNQFRKMLLPPRKHAEHAFNCGISRGRPQRVQLDDV